MSNDDIRAYGQDQASMDQLSVVIIDFETEYRTIEGKQVPRDKVTLGKIGDAQYRQSYWVHRLLGEHSDSPQIADFVRPYYENWKKGETFAHEGTPLGALAFIPKRAVQAYRMANVHTAEQLALVEDTALPRLGMDARNHRDMAKLYVQNQNSDATKTAAALKASDDKLKAMEAEMAELKAMLKGKEKRAA